MSFLRIYGRWIVLTILVSTVLFGTAGRLDLPVFWAFVVAHSGSHMALTLIVLRGNLDLLKERQQGRIYWASVIYAPLPEYRPTLKIGPRDIPIVATPNPLLIQAAKWIKEQMSRRRSHRL